jgi:hypothetical protein
VPRLEVEAICGATRVSRADGAKLRRAIESAWDAGETIEVDFGGSVIASVSFLDEGIGLLARRFPLEVLKRRLRMIRLSEPDRALLNSILVSRARERDTHLWRGALETEEWVADVLWDDGTLLGLRISRAGGDATGGEENAWWDYQAKHFAGWDAPPQLRPEIERALESREVAIENARRRLLALAAEAASSSGSTSAEQVVTLELETMDDVEAARRLARQGAAMVTGHSCVIRVKATAAE